MEPIEQLEQLAKLTGLLLAGETVAVRLRNVFEFTRDAAVILEIKGWGMKFQPVGLAIDGLAIGELVNGLTGEHVRIVEGAGTADARVVWRPLGVDQAHLYVFARSRASSTDFVAPEVICARTSVMVQRVMEHMVRAKFSAAERALAHANERPDLIG